MSDTGSDDNRPPVYQYTGDTTTPGSINERPTAPNNNGTPIAGGFFGNGSPATSGGGGGGGSGQSRAAMTSNDIVQGTDGIYYYRGADGTWISTGIGLTGEAQAAQQIAQATGTPVSLVEEYLSQANFNRANTLKQTNQGATGRLIGANPDGTLSWVGPDGKTVTGSPQEAQAAGVTPGEIEQATDEQAYRLYRSNEARYQMSAFNADPMGAQPPSTPGTPGTPGAPLSGRDPTGAPPVPSPSYPGGTPGAPGSENPVGGSPSMPLPGPGNGVWGTAPGGQSYSSPYTGGTTPALAGGAGGAGGNTMSTQGGSNYGMGTSYPASGSSGGPYSTPTYNASGLPAGTTNQGANQYLSGLQTAYGIGDSRYKLANQAAQQNLDTLNTNYNTGERNYQLGSADYTGGQTRQQYSQGIQDLQNQYNMSQSKFQLGQQGTEQANTAQQNATRQNQNQQLGQSRTLSGMGYPTQPAKVTGLS
jgi:hypothetical protein